MITKYSKKQPAIEAQEKRKDSLLRLISRDIKYNEKVVKEYHLIDVENLYNSITREKSSEEISADLTDKNYHENFEKKDKVKLFMDIDMKDKTLAEGEEIVESILTTVTKELETKYKKKIRSKEIILLKSKGEKQSYHIIIPKIYFKNIYEEKKFFERIKFPTTIKRLPLYLYDMHKPEDTFYR